METIWKLRIIEIMIKAKHRNIFIYINITKLKKKIHEMVFSHF